ncbi:MAG TPA: ABC transporter ATP-binding protein [Methylomirabilota bacterium]|nr:ABC transporter ATP-binding protein [Methylomirabilota bacterium]
MSGPAPLRVDKVRKRYGAETALAGVSLEVPAGHYVVLLGPSGSGKTTLLSIIGGFTVPTEGRVLIGGDDVTAWSPARRPTATVFQDYALFPHMSVGANVGFGLAMRGIGKAEARRQAMEALGLVGLAGFEGRSIAALSGGQRQRVALARSLVVEPAILLLDEPLGALDLHLRRQMQDELKALQRQTGRSFVHVTHDQEEAMALADLIVVMNQGRVEDMGPPARVYARPATRFAATFMGESTLIEGLVAVAGAETVGVDTPEGRLVVPGRAAAGATVAVSIRPERLRTSPVDGSVPVVVATVEETVFQGGFVRVRARAEGGTAVLAKMAPETAPAAGDIVRFHALPDDLVLLAGEERT